MTDPARCHHSFPDPYPAPLTHIGNCRHCDTSYQDARAVTNPPTIAQLHNLADRAATGLTPDEQARLREGISHLAALAEPGPATTQATEPAHNDGPSVEECRDADRRWPLQKEGQ